MIKTALVTGVAGFIGSSLAVELIKRGWKIIGIDNCSTGHKDNVQQEVEFHNANLAEFDFSKLNSVDAIFHTGIPSSTPIYRADPKGKISEALKGTQNLIDFAVKHKIKTVFASSSSIYNGNEPPFKENMPVFVTDYYTEARYSVERLFELAWSWYKVPSIGLRMFAVYGEREKYKNTFANCVTQFLWAAKRNEKITIYGDGEQTRDFTYIGDVVRAFIKAYETINEYELINVGYGKETSFNEVLKLIREIGYAPEVEYIKVPFTGYVQKAGADTTKMKQKLGMENMVDLQTGLRILDKVY